MKSKASAVLLKSWSENLLKNSQKKIHDRAHISIFASLQVGEYIEYRISSKKR